MNVKLNAKLDAKLTSKEIEIKKNQKSQKS